MRTQFLFSVICLGLTTDASSGATITQRLQVAISGLGSSGEVVQSEYAGVELSPYLAQRSPYGTEVAPFDLQFSFDANAASGGAGNAGAEFDGTYYYTTRWASDLIHKYDATGTLVEEFSIPGVNFLRDLAFDGTYMYGGNSTSTIFQMDFTAHTLIGTIPAPEVVRHIAYDPDADGFWIGSWDTDILLVSRAGATLDTISGHGLGGMFGSAHDKWTTGGPYLWVFDQGAGADSVQLVHQFNIQTGRATPITYNIGADFESAGDLAGGLFATEGIVAGTASLGGLLQGAPNWFFVYELAPDTGGGGIDPNIDVYPTLISETLAPDDSVDITVTVSNIGGADLDWSAAITSSAMQARVEPRKKLGSNWRAIKSGATRVGGGTLEWVALVGSTSGTIATGDSATFDVRLHGAASSSGADTIYTATIEVTSNDPSSPNVSVDVTLLVSAAIPDPQLSLTHTPGSLNMGIFNDGSIGAEQVGFNGPGITWKGENGCFVGGAIFGTAVTGTVNGLIGSFGIFGDLVSLSSDFEEGFTSDSDFDQIASADLDDSGAAVPYGVKILQRSYSNTGEEAGFIRYGYVNNSGGNLNDFYSGIFLDWDVDSTYLKNSGGYDTGRNLIYTFDAIGSDPYFGLIALDGLSGGRNITDTLTNVREESFVFITTFDPFIDPNGDFKTWIGSGPSNMAPGDTTWASYAVVAGDDLSGLLANADAAIAKAVAVGWIGTTGVGQPPAGIPGEFGLSQNYPNPFNPTTRITYALPQEASLTLTVYNVLGQEVTTLVNSVQRAGFHEVNWNARNTLGQTVGSGIYYYRLEAEGTSGETFTNLKKMIFLK